MVPPQVNRDELAAMRLLATVEPTFIRLLKGIWSTSARSMTSVPLELLTHPWLLSSTALPVTQKENPMWYDILTVTPAKQTFWLRRVDGKFQAVGGVDPARKRSNASVSVRLDAARDKAPEIVWRMACCFFSALATMAEVLTSDDVSLKQQHFLKGNLDGDFKDKCTCLDPSFDFGDIRFIRMARSAKQCENPEALMHQAQRASLLSDLNVARVKLLGEQSSWLDFVARKKAMEEAGQTEMSRALAAANESLEQAVATHVMSNYKSLCEPNRNSLWHAAEEHLHIFAEDAPGLHDASNVFRVDVYNLPAYGSQHSREFTDMVRQATNTHTVHPKKSVSLFFVPNCPGHGSGGGGKLTAACFAEQTQLAVNDVVSTLKSKGCTNMMVKEVVAIFKDSYSNERKRRVDFVMCVTDQVDSGGVSSSDFVKSSLWRFEAVPSPVPMQPRSEFKDWTKQLHVYGDSSRDYNIDRRQFLSGAGFWMEIMTALFEGVTTTPGSICHVREWTLYDDSLAKAALKLNASRHKGLPLFGWCGLTHNNFVRAGAGNAIKLNVTSSLCDEATTMVKNKTYTIPGFSPPVAVRTSLASMALPHPPFELCCPKDNNLQVRQTVVDCLVEKARLLEGDSMEKLKLWLSEHNEKVNRSGKNWTSGGSKRPADVETQDLPEARAVVIHPREGQPTTLGELGHPSRGKLRQLHQGDYSLLSSQDELWLLAHKDTVISDLAPLLQVRGKYEIDATAQDILSKKKHWLNFSLTSETMVTCDVTGLDKPNNVPTSPLLLNSLLSKLEVLGYPVIKLRVHTIKSPRLSWRAAPTEHSTHTHTHTHTQPRRACWSLYCGVGWCGVPAREPVE